MLALPSPGSQNSLMIISGKDYYTECYSNFPALNFKHCPSPLHYLMKVLIFAAQRLKTQLVVMAVIHHLHIKSWRIKILCKAGPRSAPCPLPTQWLIYQSSSDMTDITAKYFSSSWPPLLLSPHRTVTAIRAQIGKSPHLNYQWRPLTMWRNKHL